MAANLARDDPRGARPAPLARAAGVPVPTPRTGRGRPAPLARAAGVLAAAFVLALATCGVRAALAQPCAELPPERMVSDRHSGCLAVLPEGPRNARPQALVVMLHGDRGGELEQRHVDGWLRVGQSLGRDDRTVLFLVRPGYRSPAGDSSGYANPRDDDYTAHNVARVAGAVSHSAVSHSGSGFPACRAAAA